ncbi:ABC transporter [Rhodococcus sp. Leaf7]|uniref:ABC transporter permease n=1 Tax=unclassified Rhodococcus (in: high G+C Gram-positive bacteria) TaxID=192944 RepID=UPI0005ABB917|nr:MULTISPECIES: ABC transporter permease [unclassified Rhodococcus (in: high G+C Gram-positive bacteria)]KIQ20717.1 ABC transporter [Rhodococcus sp. MEB064]KQU02908.1 ABC transporter [Rhodococcus sp. Leaf7]KQU38707.1 ABC transporter [Rhodococcus sp. Leaf247]
MTTTNDPTTARVSAPTIADLLRDSGPRPPRPSSTSAALSFGWRALLKIKHVPEQLFDVTMFPIMFTLMFTFLFGGALAGSTSAYIQFLLPGILVQTVVMITMYTGMTLNKDIEKGVFDRFRSLPVWRPAPLVGALLGDVVRYTLASTIVLALGLALGFRPAGGVVGMAASVGLLLVFSFCVSWVWTMFALMLRSETAVMSVSMLVLFPLTFASNIFVDPTTMPGWLQAFVSVNPVSHLVTTLRGFADGVIDTDALMWTGIWSLGLLAVFGPVTMRLYNAK